MPDSHLNNPLGLTSVLRLLVILLLVQIASVFSPPLYALQGLANYVPLHTALEVLAIVISALVFFTGWVVYQKEDSANLMLLACCFLGVAMLDLMHTLSYAGMPDLITMNSPEKAINFWLMARGFAAVAMSSVAFLPNRSLTHAWNRWLILGVILLMVGLFGWIVLWHQAWMPRTFIAGLGLTEFKKNCEYVLALVYLLLAFRFYRKADTQHVYDVAGLFGAAAIMAMSEVFFTLYADVADVFNFLGHIYKIVAYGLVYKAVFMNSVALPYQRVYQSNQALKASEAKFHAIINESPVGYLLYDEQRRIRYLNRAFIATFGYTEADLIYLQDWWESAFPDHEYRQRCIDYWQRHIEQAFSSKDSLLPMELDVICKDGGKRTILMNVALLGDKLVGHQVMILQDITDQVETMQVIWKQAHLDPLTELPNRTLFLDTLAQEMAKARKNDQRMALMFIDLDRFKDVNDTLGHFMGDILLREAGRRLRGVVSERFTLSRLGGDEFTVIVGAMDNNDCIEPLAQSILACLSNPFNLANDTVYLSASIGIAIYPDDAKKSEELLKNADQAMYVAKKMGRDCFSFFTKDMQHRAQNRMRLLNELHGALDKQQLTVYYQPIVDLVSQKICKAEALLRWDHPALGSVSPSQFIPLAEETGMIVEIGDWVFRTAARQVDVWRKQFDPLFQISVNKSPVQFSKTNYDRKHWLQYLQQLGLPGQSIVVEITEGLLLDATHQVSEHLQTFQDGGIQVALDDFGTGYSSLAYLKKFHIDYLKIDQSFVSHLQAESSDMALCEAIIIMAHKLGIKVIAEGIETGEQYELLVRAGCDYGQGFLFSRPVASVEFSGLLNRQNGL
ncbi:MAG: EAL domain-containing protein [Methylomonas sp.]|jgi:predicted signal transduction protein with EAL and GGDEF domain|uniref:bifunctional diguanylate cyclase/phosphodiesterase n=1 Tax=Methylomonas sp. TaxID=418 RepID=UPI0025E89390|nr:EAL domain-containing protein [Methylomonas sp.]MCK9604919.1 EAL domain-containing protein [Methylomonas sp.]